MEEISIYIDFDEESFINHALKSDQLFKSMIDPQIYYWLRI